MYIIITLKFKTKCYRRVYETEEEHNVRYWTFYKNMAKWELYNKWGNILLYWSTFKNKFISTLYVYIRFTAEWKALIG